MKKILFILVLFFTNSLFANANFKPKFNLLNSDSKWMVSSSAGINSAMINIDKKSLKAKPNEIYYHRDSYGSNYLPLNEKHGTWYRYDWYSVYKVDKCPEGYIANGANICIKKVECNATVPNDWLSYPQNADNSCRAYNDLTSEQKEEFPMAGAPICNVCYAPPYDEHNCLPPKILDTSTGVARCIDNPCPPLSDVTVSYDKNMCRNGTPFVNEYYSSGTLIYQECDNTCYVTEVRKRNCDEALTYMRTSLDFTLVSRCDSDLNNYKVTCNHEGNSSDINITTSCIPKDNNLSGQDNNITPPCVNKRSYYNRICSEQGKDVNGSCVDNKIFIIENTLGCGPKPNQANNDSNNSDIVLQSNDTNNSDIDLNDPVFDDSNFTRTSNRVPDNNFTTPNFSSGSWMNGSTHLNGLNSNNNSSNNNYTSNSDNNNSSDSNSILGEFANKALSLMGGISDLLANPSSIGDKINNSIDDAFNSYGNRDYTNGLANRECGTIPEYSTVIRGKKIIIFSQATIDMMPMDIFKSVIIFMFVFSAVIIVFRGV